MPNNTDQQLAWIVKKLEKIATVVEYKLVPELVRLNDNLEGKIVEDDIENDGD